MDEKERIEFLRIEYQEAAKAFSLGVQVGQDLLRSYLLGTGVLGAFYGAAVSLLRDNVAIASYALMAIPIVGIIASILGIIIIRHYDRHVINCRERAAQIEGQFGGALFNSIQRVSNSAKLNGIVVFQIIAAALIALWGFLFLLTAVGSNLLS